MNIALDKNGERISPTPKARAICQVCRDELVAHCGDIYTWHWQHRNDGNCDPWKEHETEWHRTWKSRFPKDWQEVAITNEDGERHLADIRTPEGLVIEFQNSSISTQTVAVREEFYDNMIWVINAQEFRDNFEIWSSVKQKLRQLDLESRDRVNHMKYDFDKEIDELKEQLDIKKSLSEDQILDIQQDQHKLKQLDGWLMDVDSLADKIISYWRSSSFNMSLSSIASDLDPIHKDKLTLADGELAGLHKELQRLSGIKAFIEAKQEIQFEGKKLKVIEFKELSESNYHKAVLIKKESLDTFFVEGEKIKGNLEFMNARYRLNTHILAIDATDALTSIDDKILAVNIEIAKKLSLIESLKPEIASALTVLLIKRTSLLKDKLETKNDQSVNLLRDISSLQMKIGAKKLAKKDELERNERQVIEEKNKERFEIMSRNKGIYYYNWKHERQTWRVANKPIFFDMGEGVLFKKTDGRQFFKYSIDEFLNIYGLS